MMLSVVKTLVDRYSKDELENAVQKFEATRENVLDVEGPDDGEKLSNLLAAAEIRARVDQGLSLNDAIREFSKRVRSIISG